MAHTYACLSCNGMTKQLQSVQQIGSMLDDSGIVTLERERRVRPGPSSASADGPACQRARNGTAQRRLFAAAHGDGGIAVSLDDGLTWRDASSGLDHRNVYTLAVQYRGDARFSSPGRTGEALSERRPRCLMRELRSLRDVPNTELWNFPPRHTSRTSRMLRSTRTFRRRCTRASNKAPCSSPLTTVHPGLNSRATKILQKTSSGTTFIAC